MSKVIKDFEMKNNGRKTSYLGICFNDQYFYNQNGTINQNLKQDNQYYLPSLSFYLQPDDEIYKKMRNILTDIENRVIELLQATKTYKVSKSVEIEHFYNDVRCKVYSNIDIVDLIDGENEKSEIHTDVVVYNNDGSTQDNINIFQKQGKDMSGHVTLQFNFKLTMNEAKEEITKIQFESKIVRLYIHDK